MIKACIYWPKLYQEGKYIIIYKSTGRPTAHFLDMLLQSTLYLTCGDADLELHDHLEL